MLLFSVNNTRFHSNIHKQIENESNKYCYFNSYRSNARGVAILVSKNCPIKILSTENDTSGNFLSLKCEYEENLLLICVIYGPNKDSPEFFDQIFEYYECSNITNCIITGDFNTTLDHQLDNHNHRYAQHRNIRARNCLNKWINDPGFIDAYRYLHSDKKMFTWTNKSRPQRARLDMFLTIESLRPYITSFTKKSAFRSDHSLTNYTNYRLLTV